MKEFSQQSFFGSVLFAIVSLFAFVLVYSQMGLLLDNVGNVIYSSLLPEATVSMASGILSLLGAVLLYFVSIFIVLYCSLSIIIYEATETPKRRLLFPVAVVFAFAIALAVQYLISMLGYYFDTLTFLIFTLLTILFAYKQFPKFFYQRLWSGFKIWLLIFFVLLIHAIITIVVFLLLGSNPYSTSIGTVLTVIKYCIYALGLHLAVVIGITGSRSFAWKYVWKTLVFVVGFAVLFFLANLFYALPSGRLVFTIFAVLAISFGFVYYVSRLK